MLRRLIFVCVIAGIAVTHLGCSDHQQIIDRHQQTIDEEED
jgi:hypothetical protein